jgi:glycosyltransferase involved in cell wall biosynthesis
LGLGDGEKVVLWIGRFVEQKAPEVFVAAIGRLKTSPAALMVGDGPLMEGVTRLRDQLGVPIRFEGWQEDPSMHVAACDVMVSTARWEGFPLMLLEAATTGACLVATDTPGNRDAVEAGIPMAVVPPDEPVALAEAIDRLLDDDETRATMGVEARRVSVTLSQAGRSVQPIVDAYRRAIRGTG